MTNRIITQEEFNSYRIPFSGAQKWVICDVNLRDCDFDNLDMQSILFMFILFSNSNINNCDLSNSILATSKTTNLYLNKVNLSGANLVINNDIWAHPDFGDNPVIFNNVTLDSQTILNGGNQYKSILKNISITDSFIWDRENSSYPLFNNFILSNIIFNGTECSLNFIHSQFKECVINDADFSSRDLSTNTFLANTFTNCNFNNCNFSGVYWPRKNTANYNTFNDCTFENAINRPPL